LTLETSQPIHADPYATNRTTGSFLLVDPETFVTYGAGILTSIHTGDSSSESQGHRVVVSGFQAALIADKLARPLRFVVGPTILFDPQELGESLEFFVENLCQQGLTVVVAHESNEPLMIYMDDKLVTLPPNVNDIDALVAAIAKPLQEYLEIGDGI